MANINSLYKDLCNKKKASISVTFSLRKDLKDEFWDYAEKNEINRSKFIQALLMDFLENKDVRE